MEPDIELQLGLKEKQWQLSHAQVLLNDVLNQSVLLERLLEEAASLFNRIGDPSVDEDVQKKMRVEYEGIREEAQVHLLTTGGVQISSICSIIYYLFLDWWAYLVGLQKEAELRIPFVSVSGLVVTVIMSQNKLLIGMLSCCTL